MDNLGCGMTIFVIPFQDNYGQNASVESSPVQLKWSMTESIPKSPTDCVATTGHANLNLPPPTFQIFSEASTLFMNRPLW